MDTFTSFCKSWFAGGVSAAIAKTLVAPVERVKVLLQVQRGSAQFAASQTPYYTGIGNCLSRITKEQGFYSLWRGNFTNILRYFPTQAFNFAFNDFYKNIIIAERDYSSKPFKQFGINMFIGGITGSTTQILVHPLNVCQTLVASDIGNSLTPTSPKRQYRGLFDCGRKLTKREGILGLYRAFTWSILCMFWYRALYFGIYENAKNVYARYGFAEERPPIYIAWMMAQAASASASVTTYPMDTIVRRLIIQYNFPANRERKSHQKELKSFQLIKKIVKEEGFLSLFRGCLANIVRSTGGAFVLVFYDEMKYYSK